MDLVKMATDALSQRMGGKVDADQLTGALSGLLGDGKGGIDLGGLASKMASSGDLGGILKSWLGDGANDAISGEKIRDLLGDASVADFASKLGVDVDTAASGLSEVLPDLVDKASPGGNLFDAAGGVSGLLNMAKSFLK